MTAFCLSASERNEIKDVGAKVNCFCEKGFFWLAGEKYFDKVVILANVVWLHINDCCQGAVACLY